MIVRDLEYLSVGAACIESIGMDHLTDLPLVLAHGDAGPDSTTTAHFLSRHNSADDRLGKTALSSAAASAHDVDGIVAGTIAAAAAAATTTTLEKKKKKPERRGHIKSRRGYFHCKMRRIKVRGKDRCFATGRPAKLN